MISRLPNGTVISREAVAPPAPKSQHIEAGVRRSQRRTSIPGGMPTDLRQSLTGGSREMIVKRSRYVHRNSGIGRDGPSIMALYSVGEGKRPQAEGGDEDWRNEAESLFAEWARSPDIAGRFDFVEMQHLVSRAIDIDGEIFAVKTADIFGEPRLQLLESHRIVSHSDQERNIWDGVRFDAVGRPVEYLMRPNDAGFRADFIPLPARSVLHVFEPESASAARGLPPALPGLIAQHDKIDLLGTETDAVKKASELANILTSAREEALEDADFDPGTSSVASGGTDPNQVTDTLGGKTIRLDPGESLNQMTSNRPSTLFTGFLETLDRESAGGGAPYEFLGDPSKIGGAVVRMVTSKADRRFAYRQRVLERRFLTHVWVYVIGSMIDQNRLPAVPGWNKVRWTCPRRVTVDAGREAQQARADVESGLTLWSDDIGQRGGDFDEWLAHRAEEARKIMDAAAKAGVPEWMIYNPSNRPKTDE